LTGALIGLEVIDFKPLASGLVAVTFGAGLATAAFEANAGAGLTGAAAFGA
jgi:hypothetical protein